MRMRVKKMQKQEKTKVKPKKINEYSYLVEKQGDMNVPLKIFADEKLMDKMLQDRCIDQGVNVASLPGIQGQSLMMPDAHQGYGFSIGGVAAMDAETGCISPGGVGFDIGCGVRLLATSLDKEEVTEKIKPLLDKLFEHVPPGVGAKSKFRLSDEELEQVLIKGAQWCVENGHGVEQDFKHCEEEGAMPGADPSKVTQKAKSRGRGQLGTLGSGNHFIEVQHIGNIFDKAKAKAFGITHEGQICVLIHCGSRGLGHQVCSDFLRRLEDTYPEIIEGLPEKDLVYAPIKSELAEDYIKAMCAAANFAFANRHMIGVQTRKAFQEVFGKDVQLTTVYDIAHNIAKLEEHVINGEKKEVWVHRKGATRAFGPGRKEIPEDYKTIGQPIFIPGSMGTSSYVLVGTERAMKESFGSTAHGAGRLMSRKQANQTWKGEQLKKDLEKSHIHIKAASWRGISEEAPLAYKDVDEVVQVSHDAGIGQLVVQLKPIGVVKG
jgi:tRNA-splicing ligase RtcB (3'-phosphate/5'-hydroxy nucleic acid ligase)